MSLVSYRFAGPADAPVLLDLIETAYRGAEDYGLWNSESHLLQGPRTSLAELDALIAEPGVRFVIAQRGGEAFGCALLRSLPDPGAPDSTAARAADAYFGMFAVSPQHRFGGEGGRLLEACEAIARDLWRARRLTLTVISVRTGLIEWYRRRGYRITGRRFPFPFHEHSGALLADFDLVELAKALAGPAV